MNQEVIFLWLLWPLLIDVISIPSGHINPLSLLTPLKGYGKNKICGSGEMYHILVVHFSHVVYGSGDVSGLLSRFVAAPYSHFCAG